MISPDRQNLILGLLKKSTAAFMEFTLLKLRHKDHNEPIRRGRGPHLHICFPRRRKEQKQSKNLSQHKDSLGKPTEGLERPCGDLKKQTKTESERAEGGDVSASRLKCGPPPPHGFSSCT